MFAYSKSFDFFLTLQSIKFHHSNTGKKQKTKNTTKQQQTKLTNKSIDSQFSYMELDCGMVEILFTM